MREMKDSGVQWIGAIPVDWKVDNPKYHFTQRKDRAKPGMVQLTASQKYGVITQTEYIYKTYEPDSIDIYPDAHHIYFVFPVYAYND